MTAKSPNTVDQLVAARVRERRIMIGMSQEGLAEQLGITFQQVQKYEKGSNRISAGRLQNIASVLGMNVAVFFKDPADGQPDAMSAAPMSTMTLKLLVAFDKIDSDPLRKAVLDLTRILAAVSQEQAPGPVDDA